MREITSLILFIKVANLYIRLVIIQGRPKKLTNFERVNF